jgi:bacterioferritin
VDKTVSTMYIIFSKKWAATKEVAMNEDKVISLMNRAIELEYQAFIQYFYQSLKLKGYTTLAMSQFLAAEADIELGHAKLLADMVVNMGGEPSAKIEPVVLGDNPEEMIRNNIGREEKAIEIYRQLLPLLQDNEYMYDTINNILLAEVKDLDEFTALLP